MRILESHPIADLFPMMSEDESAALVSSMRTHGFDREHPIILYEGKILDGRNRYRAAGVAGVEPVTREWLTGDPWDFVWRENAIRRHLEPSQKTAIAIEFLRGSDAWKAERERARLAANEARALAASKQHEVSRPWAGERVVDGDVSRDTRPSPPARTAPPLPVAPVAHVAPLPLPAPPPSPKPAQKPTWERDKIAALVGTSPATVSRVLAVQARDAEQFERVKRGEVSASKALGEIKLEAKRTLAEEIRANPVVTPEGKYQVIVSDPPWKYDARSEDTTHRGKNLYPEMTVPEICALPVASLAQDNCILFLWTTNAFMRGAYECLDAWGFQEKTILTWDKVNLGLGDWLRNVTEHCILATRGRPIVSLTNQTTLISEKRREHSRKPEAFYALVEALCPGSKLEMFSRTPRDGWAAWGAETGKFDAA